MAKHNGKYDGAGAAEQYRILADTLRARGVDLESVKERLKGQEVETPSWGYGNSGTRFRVFGQPGVPRDPFEKFEDAAQVHKYTGICPGVAVVNPNVFQDEDYKFGSMCHPDASVRRKATDHMLECVDIAKTTGSTVL